MPHTNPLRLDPTRTGTIKRHFLADMNRRFRWLEKQVWQLVAVEDAFGLDKNKPDISGVINETVVTNKRWQFETSDKKMLHYQQWFTQQVDAGVLEVAGVPPKAPWTAAYVESAYKKGVTRAYIDSKPGLLGPIGFIEGSKAQFLNDAFNAPKGTAQIKMLGLRSFENLKGVTPAMSQRMSEVLSSGLAQGKGAKSLARDLVKQVKGINKKRALVIARTEIVHAHAEGQLDSFEKLGVEEVGVMAEWSTAGDDLVCPLCLPLEGTVFTIKEARGIIPRHPNCRCAWIPSNVGEPLKGQKRTKSQVEGAIRQSIKAEFPGVKSVAERTARSGFRVVGKRISAAQRKILRAKGAAARTAVRKVRVLRSAEDLAAPMPQLFGSNATGTIRWMGNQGWSFKEVSAVFDELGLDVADATIKSQLAAAKKGKGIIPQFTESQATFFQGKRESAIFQGVKKAKGKAVKAISKPVPKVVTKVEDKLAGLKPLGLPKKKPGVLNVEFHEGVGTGFKSIINSGMDSLPEVFKAEIAANNYTIKTGKKLTDVLPHLKDKTPKGWPPGSTWDDVGGVHTVSGGEKVVSVAEFPNVQVTLAEVKQTFVHEIGHAVDFSNTVGKGFAKGIQSQTKAFRAAYAKDTAALGKNAKSKLSHVLQSGDTGPKEMFAETFAAKINGTNTYNITAHAWESHFPEVSKWMDDFIAAKTGKLKVARATGKVAKAPVKVVTKVVAKVPGEVVVKVTKVVVPDFSSNPSTGLIRWMGSEGFDFKQVKFALKEAGVDVADNTIKAQLFAVKKGKGKIPHLNITQQDFLKKQKALAVELPKTPAKKKLVKVGAKKETPKITKPVKEPQGPALTVKELDDLDTLEFAEKHHLKFMTDAEKDTLAALRKKQALHNPAVAKVKAEAAKLPEGKIGTVPASGPHSFESGTKFKVLDSNIGGSTGAKMVEVTEPGGRVSQFVMKTYGGNESQVKNEWLANSLYNRFGSRASLANSPAPFGKLGTVNGKTAVFNERFEGAKQLSQLNPKQLLAAKEIAKDNFVMDAWLGNWDVVGMELDNMLWNGSAKGLMRIDNGGSLLYRAKGAKKGKAFADTVDELTSFRRGGKNPSAVKIFGDIGDAELIGKIDDFEKQFKLSGGFKTLNKDIAIAGLEPAEAKEITEKLFNRYHDILKQRDILRAKTTFKVEQVAISKKPKSVVRGNRKDITNAADKVHLDKKERAAIRSFTGGGYGSTNAKALSGNITSKLQNLDAALEKLPGYTGWSARGRKNVPLDHWEAWKTGKWAKVDWKAYSSSSVKPGSEFGQGKNGITYLIKNKGKQGAYVKPVSSHPSEWELTYRRNSEFRVIGWADDGPSGKRRILLIEEVDSSIPLSQVAPQKMDGKVLWEEYKSQAVSNGFSDL